LFNVECNKLFKEKRERGIKGRQKKKEEREEMNKINILVWLVGWCIPFFFSVVWQQHTQNTPFSLLLSL